MGHVNATKAGAGVPPGPKRGVGVRTVVGLPVIDAEAVRSAIDHGAVRPKSGQPRAALGGVRDDQTPVRLRTESDPESDTRYMDPPSEALGRARTEQMPESLRPTPRPPAPALSDVDMRGGVDLRSGVDMRGSVDMRGLDARGGADLRGGVDMRGLGKSSARPSAGEELAAHHAVHDAHGAQDAVNGGRRGHGPVPRTRVDMLSDRSDAPRFDSGAEPHAFRNDVRRALRNAPTSDIGEVGGRRAEAAGDQGLRLKLDADTQDIHYGTGRKSAFPRVLTWLCVLGALGGAAAFYIDTHGGLPALMADVDSLRAGTPVQNPPPSAAEPTTPTTPTAATPVQTTPPSAATATSSAQPATPAEHAPAASDTASPNDNAHEQHAAAPEQPHGEHEAAPSAPTTPAAAEPSGTNAEPPSAATPEDGAKSQRAAAAASDSTRSKPAAETPKPKAHQTPRARPAPARAAAPRRQEPVIQVRPLGDDGMLPPPPEPPSAGPSLPLDPPAPDER